MNLRELYNNVSDLMTLGLDDTEVFFEDSDFGPTAVRSLKLTMLIESPPSWTPKLGNTAANQPPTKTTIIKLTA